MQCDACTLTAAGNERGFRPVAHRIPFRACRDHWLAVIGLQLFITCIHCLLFCQVAIVGLQLFAGRYTAKSASLPVRFTDLGAAMVAAFQALTLDGWAEAMERSAADFGATTTMVYFVTVTMVGRFVVMFLFFAIILHQFEKQTPERFELMARRARVATDECSQSMFHLASSVFSRTISSFVFDIFDQSMSPGRSSILHHHTFLLSRSSSSFRHCSVSMHSCCCWNSLTPRSLFVFCASHCDIGERAPYDVYVYLVNLTF